LAAEQNDPGALFYLGYMYDHGQIVPKNQKMTVKYYSQAKVKGDSNAEKYLKDILGGPKGKEYKELLYEYYLEEWPKTFIMLHNHCKSTIIDLLLIARTLLTSHGIYVPVELMMEMSKALVLVWQSVDS